MSTTDEKHAASPRQDVISPAASSDKNLDAAYELYKKQDVTDIDPAEARRVLRKIDWHIMPLLMATYCLQYLDKSSINFASVYGLKQGTHLVGQDYAWLSSIFYFGKLEIVGGGKGKGHWAHDFPQDISLPSIPQVISSSACPWASSLG